MDHRLNVSTKTFKPLAENTKDNLCDLGIVISQNIKIINHKKIINWTFIKIKNSVLQKSHLRKRKGKPLTDKIFKYIYLTKNLYPSYIKSSYNSIIRQRNTYKNGQGFQQIADKRNIQMANKHQKMMFNILMFNILTHIKMLKFKRMAIPSAGQDIKKLLITM